jgi:hypothetical protein
VTEDENVYDILQGGGLVVSIPEELAQLLLKVLRMYLPEME